MPGTSSAARNRRLDWAIGIVVGVVLGIAIVAGFLFLGSEQTIDGASISGVESREPAREAPPAAPKAEP